MADRLSPLPNWMTRNALLKLGALVAAAATIYAVRGTISFEVPYTIPLEVRVQKGMAILEQSPRMVEAVFRGSQGDLSLLRADHLRAVVHARGESTTGEVVLRVRAEDVEGVSRVRVTDVRPSEVRVTLDREAEKRVPVRAPRLLGRPRLGDAVVEYEPQMVTVRGPEQRLKSLHHVALEPVDVEGRTESFEREIRVVPPAETWPVEILPRGVQARVRISSEMMSRDLGRRAVRAIVDPSAGVDVEVDPPAVKVVLEGAAADVQTLREEDLVVAVHCAGLDPALTYDLPISLIGRVGPTVRLVTEPSSVKVTFKRR